MADAIHPEGAQPIPDAPDDHIDVMELSNADDEPSSSSAMSSQDDAGAHTDDVFLEEVELPEGKIESGQVFYVGLDQHHSGVQSLGNTLVALAKDNPKVDIGWIPIERIRLNQSPTTKARLRQQYRRDYLRRPEVVAKRKAKAESPEEKQRRKERAQSEEFKEKKRQSRLVSSIMLKQVKAALGRKGASKLRRDILANPQGAKSLQFGKIRYKMKNSDHVH